MAKRKDKPKLRGVVKRLAELRAQREQSQPEFAKDLGISLSTLRKWEQGLTEPDPTTVAFIRLWLESQAK